MTYLNVCLSSFSYGHSTRLVGRGSATFEEARDVLFLITALGPRFKLVRRKLDCFWGEILRDLSGNYIEDEFCSTGSKPNLMSLTWLEGVNQALEFQETMIKKILVEILSKSRSYGQVPEVAEMEFSVVAGANLLIAGAAHPGDLEVHIMRYKRIPSIVQYKLLMELRV